MKKFIPVLASALLASASVNADSIYSGFGIGNHDLYSGGSAEIPLAVQPGTGDTYGGSPFSHSELDGLVKERSAGRQVDIYGAWAEGNVDLE